MSPRVAIVTCEALPLLYAEEQEILPRLRARGVEADAVVWSDPAMDWRRYDLAVIRSPWDYFKRFAEFQAWLDRVEEATRVINSPALVRWNADKMYLRDLEARGVRIVPTVFGAAGASIDVARVLADEGWSEAVVKPSVSGGAYRTHRVRAGAAAAEIQREVDAIAEASGVLVQPFMPEVESEGEWSLVFFGGVYSHTILKVPRAGDYRVQPEFGATVVVREPEGEIAEQAEAVVRALPVAAAYARIDGVRRGGEFYLMEAEVIEPYLYAGAAEGAMERFVEVVEGAARGGA